MMKRILAGSAAALFLFLSAVAQAVPIVSGSVWLVAPGRRRRHSRQCPATPPDVTFRAPSDPLSSTAVATPPLTTTCLTSC